MKLRRLLFRLRDAEVFFESRFNMRSLVFRDFSPLGLTFRIFFKISHRNIKVVGVPSEGCFCLVLDVFNALEYHPFCPLEIRMFEPVLKTQGIAETSCVETVWREAVIVHTR